MSSLRCTLRRSRSVMALAAVALAAGGLTVPVASAAHASDTTQPADQTPANLVANGGFEQGGSAGSSYTVFTTAEQGLPKWTVVSGSVETDASPSPWVAAEGSRSANLDGNEPGAMEQTVSDTVGSTYHLRFAAAVHSCGPATASFTVSWHGSVVDTVTVTRASLPSGGGPYDPKWTYFDYDVVGHGNDALRFTSLSPSGSCGPILDDVSLTARTAALTGVSLTATPADTPPGAQQVPTAGVPFDQVPGSALAAVAAAPLRSVPLRSVPLRSVPLRSVPLRSVDLSSSPLRSVTLNQVPLLGSLTWADILAGTTLAAVPLQNVTLDQVLSLSPAPAALNGSTADGELTLDQVDLQSSPLRSVSLASVYLGGVALGDLPTATDDGAPTGQTLYQAVCATADCTALKLSSSSPLLAADLAGVPLRSVPLRSVPLRSVPIGAPLRSVPLRSVPLRSVPLRSVRLGGVGGLDIPAATNLAAIPLSALSPTSVLLTSVQYSAVAQALGLGACATVCETLGDAVVAGVAAKVTLGDLATKTDAIAQLTLGDVGPFDASGALSALTIGDIADAFPATFSLADALFSLIDPDSVPWEQLPFDALALPEHDADGATVSYTASFTVSGGGGPLDATATVVLPPGYELAGAASGLPAAAAEPTVTGTVASGQTLVWTVRGLVPGTSAAAVSFTFRVRPGLVLGQGTATLQVQTSVPTPGSPASAQAQVTVVDDGATSVGDAPVVGKSTLVVGHTSSPDRITYLKVPVPAAGTRVTFLLSHLPIDADLVVYGPPVSDASLLRSVPLRSVPLPDPGVDASGAPSATALLQGDVPLLTGYPLAGFGAQRGTGDEEVDTLSSGGGGYYTVQVTGYDGAASPQPWMFRVAETTPVETTCPARSWPTQTGSASGLPEIAGGIRSLFLVNAQQLRAEYGDQQTSDLLSELTTFAERSDVAGVVVQVDQDDDVAAAYNAWNAHPCSIEAANAVAGQVAQLVRDYRDAQLKITHDARQTISSVTLVGGDEQLPMARLADLTSAVNERGFAESDLNLDGSDNPFTAAQKAGYLLSDDPYGTLRTVPWLDRQLYVPELGIGRLVETPAQIEGQLKQFVASGGVVDPASSLTTGYDFLSDGAQAVDAALAPTVSRHRTLISETWTRADLLGDLLPKRGNGPSIASVNAHFDQSRALPAAGNTSGDESDLVTTADLAAAPGALAGRLLFSMGCHAALSVPAQYSGIAGAPETADWAKELATQRALWVGNTGYGLGDSATVALSEALMRNFAKRLDGHLLAGAALSYAKQDYLGSLGAYGAADEKALQEIAFYGLPMWRIGGPRSDGQQDVQPPAPAAPATVPVTGVDGGLSVHDDVTTPTFQRTNLPSGASFWSVAGETQATAGQPVQPRTSRPAAAGSSAGTAKGVLVTSLSSHDVPGVTPQVARAVLDDAGNEPAPTSATAAFPSGVATLSTFATPSGDDTRLVLLPGQFIPTKGGKGVQRLFDSVGTRVFYGTGDDYRLPTFSRLRAAADDSGTVTFTVDVAAPDDRPVRQVLVLARVGGGAGTWQPVDLTHGTGTTWTGTLPGVTGPFEWFAQAVAPSGTVALSADQRALSTVGYAFGGFQAPIHPLAVNRVKAGSAVPVTFVLRTQDGPVGDPSAVVSISSATSASCACPARGATTDSMTVSDPLSSLRLDRATGRFTYVWKTDRSWSGQCRVLTVALDDGTSHQVLFQLR